MVFVWNILLLSSSHAECFLIDLHKSYCFQPRNNHDWLVLKQSPWLSENTIDGNQVHNYLLCNITREYCSKYLPPTNSLRGKPILKIKSLPSRNKTIASSLLMLIAFSATFSITFQLFSLETFYYSAIVIKWRLSWKRCIAYYQQFPLASTDFRSLLWTKNKSSMIKINDNSLPKKVNH